MSKNTAVSSRSVTSIINALCEELGITPEEFARRDVTPDPYWIGLQPWLEEQGYQLRPRFRPGWTPSWLAEGFKGDKWDCEDYQVYYNGDVMDALRMRDGALVMFKRANRNHEWSEEAQLAEFLSDPLVASDSRNHCVPIYDILEVPDKKNEILIVVSLLSHYDHPSFETVGEVVIFLQQMIEMSGLLFLHSHNIVHRDLKYHNILADGGALYNERLHPVKPLRNSQKSYHGYKPIQQRFPRTTKPVNYFYIDFGFSKKYASRTGNIEFSPWGPLKYHEMIPEFNAPNYTPADPFPVDVCMLGIVIREHFVAGSEGRYSGKANMEWMDALTREMMIDDPVARPTIEEVMERYTALTEELGSWKLRSPVYDLKEWTWPWTRARHWIVQIYRMVRGIPAVPTPRHQEILR